MELNVQLLNEHACMPTRATERSAGLDLYFPGPEPLVILPGRRVRVHMGISIALPAGHEGQVRPRSGMSEKTGLLVVLGTIDEDYRGEIGVLILHEGTFPQTISRKDRIAQLIISPVSYATPVRVGSLQATVRGVGGFGSTGR